jgi:hypothetical protein
LISELLPWAKRCGDPVIVVEDDDVYFGHGSEPEVFMMRLVYRSAHVSGRSCDITTDETSHSHGEVR